MRASPGKTRSGLGEPITAQEKAELRAQLRGVGLSSPRGGGGGVSLADIGSLVGCLPSDMMFVMRTMHLVMCLHKALGGGSLDRFKATIFKI